MNKELPFLLNEWKISRWACMYCIKIKDNPTIRKFIKDPYWASRYCFYICDDPEVRKYITDEELLKELENE